MIKKIGWGFPDCNFKCPQCYSAAKCNSVHQHSLGCLKEIADKICPQITDINIGTGEGVVNLNMIPLLKYIKQNHPHVKLAITSNGTVSMMDKGDIKRLFHDIDVSLDFPNPQKHDANRGHPFAWDWAVKTLMVCEKMGVEKSITTCVTDNLSNDEILDFLALAKKYNANWRVNWYRRTGRDLGLGSLRLSPKRFWEIMLFLVDQGAEFESLCDPLLASVFGVPEQNPISGCSCGALSCRIQPNFDVTPCVFLGGAKWSGGSIQEKSLNEIFESEIFKRIRNRAPEFCQGCQFEKTCAGGCASRAFLHSGGIDQPDDCCPKLAGLNLDGIVEKINKAKANGKFKIAASSDKVHAGYLCTMIVKV